MVIRQLTIAETIISNQALFRLNSMNIKFDLCNIKWPNRFAIILGVFLVISIFFALAGMHKIYAVGAFSKADKPFNISYDNWVSKFWNQWIGKNANEAEPKPGGCLVVNNNKSESMVMVIDLADVNFPPTQECKISSNQGIMIPLWVGWCDTGA